MKKENDLISGEGNISDFKIVLKSFNTKINEFRNTFSNIIKSKKNTEKEYSFYGPAENSSEVFIEAPGFTLEEQKASVCYQSASNEKAHYFILQITSNNNRELPSAFLKGIYKDVAINDPLVENLAIDNISYLSSDYEFYVFYTALDEKSGYQASQLLRSITDLKYEKNRGTKNAGRKSKNRER